jgi:hypothetical protein
MKSLICRAMYHPFIAQSSFFLTDLMCKVDYSLSGALLVLISKSMSRLLSLLSKGYRRRDEVASLLVRSPGMPGTRSHQAISARAALLVQFRSVSSAVDAVESHTLENGFVDAASRKLRHRSRKDDRGQRWIEQGRTLQKREWL